MFKIFLINRLARALLLAVMGVILAAGTAAAHDGHAAVKVDRIHTSIDVAQGSHQPVDHVTNSQPLALDVAVHAQPDDHGSVPCSSDRSAGHVSGNCCTVACHAALATPALEPLGGLELAGLSIVALTNMLVGQSGDRTERPPKLS